MPKTAGRELVALICSICKRQNYITTRNKVNIEGKLELMKYCKWDKKYTLHKESLKLK